jgi:hypothetical protein
MRRPHSRKLIAVSALALGSLLFAPSCATNDSSLYIVGVLAIDSSNCIAQPDGTSALLAGGTMDIQFVSGYRAFVLVGNQLTQRGSREQLRTETSRITLRGAEIQLTDVTGAVLYPKYSTAGTGFVDPSTGTVAGLAAMGVDVIPSGLPGFGTQQKPFEIVAKIRVFGDTLGGESIKSSELDFPITICDGCLVTYPPDAADTGAPNGTYLCARQATSSSSSTTGDEPCRLGQDKVFSCSLCSATSDVCRDPLNNMSYNP